MFRERKDQRRKNQQKWGKIIRIMYWNYWRLGKKADWKRESEHIQNLLLLLTKEPTKIWKCPNVYSVQSASPESRWDLVLLINILQFMWEVESLKSCHTRIHKANIKVNDNLNFILLNICSISRTNQIKWI